MIIKEEIRILGWDDGSFHKGEKGKVILVGTIFRGGSFMDGMLKTEIKIDGLDATMKIVKAVKKTKHKDLRVIMLGGITFGGFNFVNIKELYRKTGLPVLVVIRRKTNMKKFREAMKRLPDFEKRWESVENAGDFFRILLKGKGIYFQKTGLTEEEAKKIIKLTARRGLIPEPLRVAHLIASGIVKGESIGRA
ncbi:MAG: DUF99 family protein [Candidatus Aenigmarchaeota archaeon]|nr:DUF99 family protein [Candidatus Aenigmarchaeota archaeon]